MASFDTSKIVSDIKSGKIKRKEPPKYIFVKNPRNNRKTKKLNPRWTAWSKRQKDKKIDKDVETYVKKNQKGKKINKDLTKDFSKNKESGVGPIREGNKYAKNIKNSSKNVGPVKDGDAYAKSLNNKRVYKKVTQEDVDKKLAENKENKGNKLKIKKGSARNFIKTKKGFARRGTPMAKRAEERERKRKALGAKGYMKR